jgi:hypothetical protein
MKIFFILLIHFFSICKGYAQDSTILKGLFLIKEVDSAIEKNDNKRIVEKTFFGSVEPYANVYIKAYYTKMPEGFKKIVLTSIQSNKYVAAYYFLNNSIRVISTPFEVYCKTKAGGFISNNTAGENKLSDILLKKQEDFAGELWFLLQDTMQRR